MDRQRYDFMTFSLFAAYSILFVIKLSLRHRANNEIDLDVMLVRLFVVFER